MLMVQQLIECCMDINKSLTETSSVENMHIIHMIHQQQAWALADFPGCSVAISDWFICWVLWEPGTRNNDLIGFREKWKKVILLFPSSFWNGALLLEERRTLLPTAS